MDRFVIERLLGRGGMAEVYAARDRQLRRLVALKRLRRDQDDDAATARLLREARAAASFQHPGAVTVYDVFEHEGSPYMAMELVSGRTLRSYIGDPSIPAPRRLRWLIDVARALGAAHRAGLVHRDVKPHNVMVSDEGMIKVLDFGIARAQHKRTSVGEDTSQSIGALTDPGAIVGTPLYASPEQLSAAAIDDRSDQFAWGVMGYELCCGLLPWRRRDTLTMLAQLVAGDIPSMEQRLLDAAALAAEAPPHSRTSRSTPPPPPPSAALFTDVLKEVEHVFKRALQREPDDRYSSIEDAADDLEPFAEEPRSTRFVPRSMLPAPESSGAAVPATSTLDSPPEQRADPGGAMPTLRTTQKPHSSGSPKAPRTPKVPAPSPVSARSMRDAREPDRPRATPNDGGSRRAQLPPSPAEPRSVEVRSVEELSAGPRSSRGTRPVEIAPAPPLEPARVSPTPAPSSTTTAPVDPGVAAPDPRAIADPITAETLPLWRRAGVRLGAFALLAAAAVSVASALYDKGRTPPSGALAGPPPPEAPKVARVHCAAAEVRGPASVPSAAEALGRGACVRLAVALGVPWDPAPGDAPLAVTVESGTTTRATLTLAGQTASAEGAKPMAAVDAAARALAVKIAAPSMSAEQQSALGAQSEPDARRVDAALRRHVARLAEDPAAGLKEAMAAAPQSPWPRLYAMSSGTTPEAERLRDETLAAAASLPGPLAEAARGAVWQKVPKTDAERADALSALRRAYAARPDDGHVAAALAEALLAAGLYEEAAGVGARAADRTPHESLAPLAVLVQDGPPDPTWIELRGRLLDRLETLLPEARGWDARVRHEALSGRVAQARESLALGDALGLPSATGSAWARDLARAAVEIADDRPAEARALLQPFLGAPSAADAAEATCWLVQSYLLEGRIADAETALARDIARLEALRDQPRLAERWSSLLGMRRTVGQPPAEFVDVRKLEAALPALEARESPLAPVLRAEIFLARLARRERTIADAAAVQREIEAYARKVARGDRARQDDLAMGAVPVVMAGSGMPGLRALWRSLDRARFAAKLPYMLVHGVASEQAGDLAEAERDYRAVASAPLSVSGLDNLAARFRLARILDRTNRKAEAARWRESAARLLQGADQGVREQLEKKP